MTLAASALLLALAQSPDGGTPDAGTPDGAALFLKHGCVGCHPLDGAKGTGPALRGLFGTTVTLQSGATVVADEAYLRESIRKPGAKVVAGYLPLMPFFGALLRPEELDALVDFVRALPPLPADAGR
ncbi:MAG: cytochrome c [Myxococcaceae bacterium]|nr:cytochrome c [Myxococcaceae bacterium]